METHRIQVTDDEGNWVYLTLRGSIDGAQYVVDAINAKALDGTAAIVASVEQN